MEPVKCLEWFGQPALGIAGFRLWVQGRQFPDSNDYWDGNWLNVTAHCEAAGASVQASGALLLLPDIARWASDAQLLHSGKIDDAVLHSYEPELAISVHREGRLGHLILRVELTPVHLQQGHWFKFEIDQSHLPLIVSQCRAIVKEYGVRSI